VADTACYEAPLSERKSGSTARLVSPLNHTMTRPHALGSRHTPPPSTEGKFAMNLAAVIARAEPNQEAQGYR